MKHKTTHKHTSEALQSKTRGFQKKVRGNLPKKKKQPSKSTLKLEAWRWFSKYIRLRDCMLTTGSFEYGECVSCDKTFPFAQLDAGHFIPKKSGNYFSERGVNAQCRSCNRYHNANQLEYRREIIRRYGVGVDEELEQEARQIIKRPPEDLTNLAEQYKMKVEKLLRGG